MRAHMDARTGIFDTDDTTGTCLWQHGTGFYATDCGEPADGLFCPTHDDPALPGYAAQVENCADWPPADPFTDD